MKTLCQISKGLILALLLYTWTPLNGQVTFKNYRSLQKEAVGKDMPDLVFETVLNGMKNKKLTAKMMQGKVVILEFWTTWCAPCIKQFPKINALAKEYQEDVVFISITPEKLEIVNPFLKRKSLETWIAMDTDESVIDYFGVIAYPTTIVIDKKGKVVEYINPMKLSNEYLNSIISGNHPDQTVSKEASKPKVSAPQIGGPQISGASSTNQEEDKNGSKPVYQVNIKEIPDLGGSYGGSFGKQQGRVNARGWSVREALAFATNIPEKGILGPDSILNKKLELQVSLPSGNPEMLELILLEGLKKELNIVAKNAKQNMEVYEITAPEGVSKDLFPTRASGKSGHISTDDGILGASNWSLDKLMPHIEKMIDYMVVNNTGLTDNYDYNLYWEYEKPMSIIDALSDQLGLVASKKNIEMSVLVVESKDNDLKK